MGDNFKGIFDEIIDKFTFWAQISDDVKSALIIGSRARIDRPADEYSDLDLIMVVTNPDYYLSTNQWLENIGAYWISFTEDTIGGGKERRILFENALDVDFVIFSEQGIKQFIEESDVQKSLGLC